MLELVARVVPLGIGAAITPSLLALSILAVDGERWRARALAVAGAVALAFGIACAVLLAGFMRLPSLGTGPIGPAIVWVGAGLALAGLAVFFLLPHPGMQERAERAMRDEIADARPRAFFLLAFVLSIKDVSSFVLLVPAMHDIATAGLALVPTVVIAAAVFALALSPVLVPPLLKQAGGRRADAALSGIYRFTMDHQLAIAGIVCAVLAAYCLAVGV